MCLNRSTSLNRPRAKPLPLLPPPRTPLPHRSSSSTPNGGFARPNLSAIICHYTSPFEPWPCCMASDSKCGRRVALSSGTRSTTYCLKVLLRTGRPRSLPCVTLKCVKSQDVGGDADGGTAPAVASHTHTHTHWRPQKKTIRITASDLGAHTARGNGAWGATAVTQPKHAVARHAHLCCGALRRQGPRAANLVKDSGPAPSCSDRQRDLHVERL